MGKAKGEQSVQNINESASNDYYGNSRFDRGNASKTGLFGQVPNGNFTQTVALNVSGGVMGGAIGHTKSIVPIVSGKLSIARDTENYSGFIQIQAESGTTDDLTDIDDAFYLGQELFLQADTGDTITIKTSGNIDTHDGSDFTLSADSYIYRLYR